ncbi:MAG: SDR family NAD(P)-dependent oxidoreductase, partial [Actinomycetota bacterium]
MALPPPSESATALITGASAGIGEAIARQLASRG